MNRRQFIKNSSFATIGLATGPYLLPSGRLFAPTGKRIANHVVFCLFAGGIRNFESLHKAEGNLMPCTLNGNETISKDIIDGFDPVPQIQGKALQNFGTLFRNFRYDNTKTIHYTAHASAIMGVYSPKVQLMKPLNYPSVFEYYRKHNTPKQSALNAWWVSDQAGPFSYLNYSDYPEYGSAYGANMIQPTSFLNRTWSTLSDFSNSEKEIIRALTDSFNERFPEPSHVSNIHQIENTEEDRERLSSFIKKLSNQIYSANLDIWHTGKFANEDVVTMFSATEILKEFKPELLVVNMQHSDIGHSSFTSYCSNIRKADYALYQLWETIQSIPEMKDDTILIVAPEFGRNLKPNTLIDAYGRFATDHTGDENSKNIFCLIVGPPDKVKQGLEVTEVTGETIDIVPTISRVLGFDDYIPKNLLSGRFLEEAFI